MPQVFTEGQKEQAKWEMFDRDCPRGLQPGNPYRKGNEFGKAGAEYPKMLYKASRLENGKYAVAVQPPQFFGFRDQNEWDRAVQNAMAFNASCQRTVSSESDHTKARADGWRDDPKEALDYQDSLDKLMGQEAAERNFRDKNMGEKALAESLKTEADHFGHLPVIPEQPIVKRRGRPKKVAPEAA